MSFPHMIPYESHSKDEAGKGADLLAQEAYRLIRENEKKYKNAANTLLQYFINITDYGHNHLDTAQYHLHLDMSRFVFR